MAFTLKMATFDDLAAATAVEREAMGNYVYLQDAWHYFNSQKGGLICVYDKDRMVGIGRFTVLPDGTGWLETLRVTPQYQRRGVGRMIYEQYSKLAQHYGCPSMAMFTGITNAASSGLAEVFGLKTAAQHKGWHLTDITVGSAHGFKAVNWQKAPQLILPLKEQYHNYFTFNRTFYHINEANARQFAIEGKVYEDAESGSFIVCGARFQHQAALHIAMMGGDLDKCIDFAINLASAQNIPKISCTFALDNPELENALKARGFVAESGTIITKEIVF